MIKRFLLCLILLIMVGSSILISAYSLIPIRKTDGTNLKYRNTDVEVLIPDEYTLNKDFRAVWVSHLVSDFPQYQNESQYKQEVNKVLDTMQFFNMNAIIFHIRTHNDALYKSSLNPVSKYYQNVNFNVFDPLEYIIQESHRRGIEFHAWLNPYRLSTTFSGTVEEFAANQAPYNIASNPEMILKSGSSLILNPGEPGVRNFLVDTVMEVVERYDVDAIHFDDYFYISGVNDDHTRNKYNDENLSLGNFRRKQIDIFIEQLSTSLRNLNKQTGRVIQLGISPSGIYRNGSYVPLEDYTYNSNGDLTYPLYSNSQGFAHYDDYLYSDTKNWIDKEWIDYIIPQIYWSFEQPVAPFADILDWWTQVVKYKNVNLYIGMGLYMIDQSTAYSWKSNDEAIKQIFYGSKYSEVQGYSIFSYKHIRYAYERTSGYYVENMNRVKSQAWYSKAILPDIRTFSPVVLNDVQNLMINKANDGYQLNFNAVNNAKSYIIYRSVGELTYSPDEVIDILGVSSGIITFNDIVDNNQDFNYGIKVMSNTNTLSTGVSISSESFKYVVNFLDYDGTLLKREAVELNASATAPSIPVREGYSFTGWDVDFNVITNNLDVRALYTINQYTVSFFDGQTLIASLKVNHGENAIIDDPVKEGYTFIGWNRSFNNITSDLIVYGYFARNIYTVTFIGRLNQVLKTEEVEHGDDATAPVVSDSKFIGWDQDFKNITSDVVINALFSESYSITFKADDVTVFVVNDASIPFTMPEIPQKHGYDQVDPVWDVTDFSEIIENMTVNAIYTINVYKVSFYDRNNELISEEMVEHGAAAEAPVAPEIEGYRFLRWNSNFSYVIQDMDVKALYQVASKSSCASFKVQTVLIPLFLGMFIFLRRRKF